MPKQREKMTEVHSCGSPPFSTGKYRQAFRIYDRNKDYSLMVHLLAKAELESLDRIQDLQEKLENRRIMDEKNYIKRKGR